VSGLIALSIVTVNVDQATTIDLPTQGVMPACFACAGMLAG
jgi:hypothetical protein